MMLLSYSLSLKVVIFASKLILIHLIYYYREVYPEFEYSVYSFVQARNEINKSIFFGVLNHNKDTAKFFIEHGFKTVPYITVSLQKLKRLEDEEFYKEEDRWLVR